MTLSCSFSVFEYLFTDARVFSHTMWSVYGNYSAHIEHSMTTVASLRMCVCLTGVIRLCTQALHLTQVLMASSLAGKTRSYVAQPLLQDVQRETYHVQPF